MLSALQGDAKLRAKQRKVLQQYFICHRESYISINSLYIFDTRRRRKNIVMFLSRTPFGAPIKWIFKIREMKEEKEEEEEEAIPGAHQLSLAINRMIIFVNKLEWFSFSMCADDESIRYGGTVKQMSIALLLAYSIVGMFHAHSMFSQPNRRELQTVVTSCTTKWKICSRTCHRLHA